MQHVQIYLGRGAHFRNKKRKVASAPLPNRRCRAKRENIRLFTMLRRTTMREAAS